VRQCRDAAQLAASPHQHAGRQLSAAGCLAPLLLRYMYQMRGRDDAVADALVAAKLQAYVGFFHEEGFEELSDLPTTRQAWSELAVAANVQLEHQQRWVTFMRQYCAPPTASLPAATEDALRRPGPRTAAPAAAGAECYRALKRPLAAVSGGGGGGGAAAASGATPNSRWRADESPQPRPKATSEAAGQQDGGRDVMPSTTSPGPLAPLPSQVPHLPDSFQVTSEMKRVKALLLPSNLDDDDAVGARVNGGLPKLEVSSIKPPAAKVLVAHGMGGVGKSTLAAWLARLPEVRHHFELILWVNASQTPNIQQLQQLIYLQSTGRGLAPGKVGGRCALLCGCFD
jgi:hypothetical protein